MSDTPRYVVNPMAGVYRDGEQISPWQMAADIANMLDRLTREQGPPAWYVPPTEPVTGDDLAPYFAVIERRDTQIISLPVRVVEAFLPLLLGNGRHWPRPWGMRWNERGGDVEIVGPWLRDPSRAGDRLAFAATAIKVHLDGLWVCLQVEQDNPHG